MAQPVDLLTDRQRQTLPARQALAEKFSSPEERSKYFSELGRKSADSRLTLSGDEAAALVDVHSALVDAYSLLSRIAERARLKLGDTPNEAA